MGFSLSPPLPLLPFFSPSFLPLFLSPSVPSPVPLRPRGYDLRREWPCLRCWMIATCCYKNCLERDPRTSHDLAVGPKYPKNRPAARPRTKQPEQTHSSDVVICRSRWLLHVQISSRVLGHRMSMSCKWHVAVLSLPTIFFGRLASPNQKLGRGLIRRPATVNATFLRSRQARVRNPTFLTFFGTEVPQVHAHFD